MLRLKMAFVNKLTDNIKTVLSLALMGLVCLGLGPVGSNVHNAESYLAVDADTQPLVDLAAPSLSSQKITDSSGGHCCPSCFSFSYTLASFHLAQKILFKNEVPFTVLLRHQYLQIFSATDPDSAIS